MASNRQSVRSQIPPAKGSRPKPTPRSRSVAPRLSFDDPDSDSGRVRVAIRLRPKNAEDLACDPDFIDCVELQPELKRLKLRKNNWSSDSYRFDEVFTESASQRRVYDAVAKPVVESVLNGYNGTVMAYGQTGTGKTFTVGQLGKEDPSERGIMVRALEDILAYASPRLDSVRVTYLQLYLESIQDLLAPEKTNIPITEDPKTGEVLLSGATLVEIRNLDQFLELLQIGEANRHAANTKLNTESSRSHAILMVHIQRSSKVKEESEVSFPASNINSDLSSHNVPILLKSKLLIVDLAGSERVNKSGSEGHMLEEAKFINLSLTSLGKCINALAENNAHIPTRDSKLTRLLRDSFGDSNQEKIVEEGGLDALLMLLESTEDSTALRVTAGAVANLAMNGLNQGLIVSKGGGRLLANIAFQTDDSQTLRMVAGAIANLCGNERLHLMLKEDGGIKSLLAMVKYGNSDVIAQVARGIANFAKCESRGVHQGDKIGKSLLIEDGVLDWIIENPSSYSSSTRRHIELALCHLAQNEYNATDIISSGGIKELVRISQESSKEEIRNLAKKALNANPAYLAKVNRY